MVDHSKNAAMICLGAFAGSQGVRGDAKVKTFTGDAQDITAYGKVESEDGARQFTLKFMRLLKPELALVRAPEIKNREDAQALAGTRLYVARKSLSDLDDDEFYFEDLIGLKVRLFDDDGLGEETGQVSKVHNFGAGDIVELINIKGHKGPHLVPFIKEAIPKISIDEGYITLHIDYLPDDGTNDAQERNREEDQNKENENRENRGKDGKQSKK